MLWRSLFIRIFLFQSLWVTPLSLLGFFLLGSVGAVLGLIVSYSLLLGVVFRSEQGLRKKYAGLPNPFYSLENTLNWIMLEVGGIRPQIFICQEPLPKAIVARGLASHGSLILSKGLLILLNENELRSVMKNLVLRSQKKDMIFNTLCSYLVMKVLGITPKGWTDLFHSKGRLGSKNLSPLWALVYLPSYPWIAILLKFCRTTKDPPRIGEWDQISSAERKIQHVTRLWKLSAQPYENEVLSVIEFSP